MIEFSPGFLYFPALLHHFPLLPTIHLLMNTLISRSLCLLLCWFLFACDDTQQADTEADGTDLVELPDTSATRAIAPAAEQVPELIGTWQLQEMWVGNSQMSVGDVGETYVQFKTNNMVVSMAPNMSPDSSAYQYTPEQQRIEAQALQGEQTIQTLSEDELVLSYEVDGEEVRSVYVRMQP